MRFKCGNNGQWQFSVNWMWILLLPIFIVGCGGSLGKIQLENVDEVITHSEQAIRAARSANAAALAPKSLELAENYLTDARKAVEAEAGLDAIRFAYDARTQARIAEQEAMYKSQEAGLNAIIQRKEMEIADAQENLGAAEAKLEKARTEIQQLDIQRAKLILDKDSKIQELNRDNKEARRDYDKVQRELRALQVNYDATQKELMQAQERTKAHERDIYQLRRELALSQSLVDEARKTAKQAQTKATEQAKSYTKRIERLTQANVGKKRKVNLNQKAQAAREYVRRQQVWRTPRTGTTSLTNKQISNGKRAIDAWYLAWASKDIDQHLGDYAQNVEINQIHVRSGSEKHTALSRAEMVKLVSERINESWKKTHASYEADGKSVIGTYRFSQPAANTGNENAPTLYNVWEREVWAREMNNRWKIHREGWRFYEAVPKYATVFN